MTKFFSRRESPIFEGLSRASDLLDPAQEKEHWCAALRFHQGSTTKLYERIVHAVLPSAAHIHLELEDGLLEVLPGKLVRLASTAEEEWSSAIKKKQYENEYIYI